MANSLEQYLDADDAAGRVMAHARLLLRLERGFAASVPAGLAAAAHVANYKSGKLIIHADNGAVAAKLRQMGTRICSELSKSGAECSGIDVRVQPRQIRTHSSTSTEKPLSMKTVAQLRSTAKTLPKGPLQAALETLLTRAAKAE